MIKQDFLENAGNRARLSIFFSKQCIHPQLKFSKKLWKTPSWETCSFFRSRKISLILTNPLDWRSETIRGRETSRRHSCSTMKSCRSWLDTSTLKRASRIDTTSRTYWIASGSNTRSWRSGVRTRKMKSQHGLANIRGLTRIYRGIALSTIP